MSPLISIIIPAYNCGTSIRETLESILSQQMKNYELLIINDGSTDNTEEILSEYEAEDHRIRVKTIENVGPANARNVGISLAQGDYIMFVDSDDTLQPNTLDVIEKILCEQSLDLIIFGFYIRNTIENQVFKYSAPECFLSDEQAIIAAFPTLYFDNLLNQIWNKVYRADLIRSKNIVFLDYRYGEDRLFVLDVLRQCRKVQVLEKCYYNYFMRAKQSLVTAFYDKKALVCNLIDRKVKQLITPFEIIKPEDLKQIRYMYVKSMLSCITNLFSPSCPYTKKEKNEALRELLSSSYLQEELTKYQRCHFITDITAFVMKTRWVWLNRWMAKFILYMSRRHPSVFIKSKHPGAKNIQVA
ncbi:glycosyltransferase family 2 protein [Neobittarella massiliensis]|uniref:Glycosyltransferase family 2 protein n=1 Tax=Neobittarella massiliensis (ex Bilen et al. 2018) TaxID=2041842 RepID=A0A8J6IQ95_9FIRM|nr:glycosyltransferase family 2 protein [Neobittarella massiliensis]MBC3516411.1 glycosyltransferase family 2 protein [Neobittarella massiliensis]